MKVTARGSDDAAPVTKTLRNSNITHLLSVRDFPEIRDDDPQIDHEHGGEEQDTVSQNIPHKLGQVPGGASRVSGRFAKNSGERTSVRRSATLRQGSSSRARRRSSQMPCECYRNCECVERDGVGGDPARQRTRCSNLARTEPVSATESTRRHELTSPTRCKPLHVRTVLPKTPCQQGQMGNPQS